jgi:cystathionine beta-synthase
LRDIISRRYSDGGVITVSSNETLMVAFNRMRNADISQLPVMSDGKIIGLIDESDILLKVTQDTQAFRQPVESTMTQTIETLTPRTDLATLQKTLNRGLVAIIADEGRFYGLITRFDLINHLRRSMA